MFGKLFNPIFLGIHYWDIMLHLQRLAKRDQYWKRTLIICHTKGATFPKLADLKLCKNFTIWDWLHRKNPPQAKKRYTKSIGRSSLSSSRNFSLSSGEVGNRGSILNPFSLRDGSIPGYIDGIRLGVCSRILYISSGSHVRSLRNRGLNRKFWIYK